MEITEIRREPRVSVLSVRGFHTRPQAGTHGLSARASLIFPAFGSLSAPGTSRGRSQRSG